MISILSILLVSLFSQAEFTQVIRHPGTLPALEQDFQLILNQAELPSDSLHFSFKSLPETESHLKNEVQISCPTGKQKTPQLELIVSAHDNERVSTLYYGLQKLGFLFPHPRWQISPTMSEMQKHCGKKYVWQPRFPFRGMHLHTLHPSEWVHGFLMNQPKIAEETIRWHARNGQNIIQLVLLEQSFDDIARQLNPLIELSQSLGVSFGIDLSIETMQQKHARLVSPDSKWRFYYLLLFKRQEEKQKDIEKSLHALLEKINFDFMTLELGTSEFTPSNYQLTIDRLNKADDILKAKDKHLFIKIHSSVNQHHPELGNFNFVPSYAQKTIGVLPHTVMFYSMVDEKAPAYGRKDFKDMLDFTARESKVRPVWYYPETSYYIAMDIDVPIFLTDFLLSRSEDMRAIEKLGTEGHLNFTTGQELGYWFFDWNTALLGANAEFRDEDAPAARLLGENVQLWKNIMDYQRKYFKKAHLIEELSSSNLLDELPLFNERTIERYLLKELKKKPVVLKERIDLLHQAITESPDISQVKNTELRTMLEITQLRLQHALFLRQALLAESEQGRDSTLFKQNLNQAERIRLQALEKIQNFIKNYERYPEAMIFARQQNITSYPFGYGWTASNLHFWEREEEMIRQDKYWPWFMQIINPLNIIF